MADPEVPERIAACRAEPDRLEEQLEQVSAERDELTVAEHP
ncbi:hypothetical protein [Streptomyces tendae]